MVLKSRQCVAPLAFLLVNGIIHLGHLLPPQKPPFFSNVQPLPGIITDLAKECLLVSPTMPG